MPCEVEWLVLFDAGVEADELICKLSKKLAGVCKVGTLEFGKVFVPRKKLDKLLK